MGFYTHYFLENANNLALQKENRSTDNKYPIAPITSEIADIPSIAAISLMPIPHTSISKIF